VMTNKIEHLRSRRGLRARRSYKLIKFSEGA
jgi:hypothetical protein